MTRTKEPTMITNIIITKVVPAIVFISSIGMLYGSVKDLKVTVEKTLTTVHQMSERLTKVETKVQFLYDERKRGN